MAAYAATVTVPDVVAKKLAAAGTEVANDVDVGIVSFVAFGPAP